MLTVLLRRKQKLFLLVALVIGVRLSLGPSIQAQTNPNHLIIENFTNGEVIHYDLPLLKGTATGSSSVLIMTDDSSTEWSVHDGRWRAFVPLQIGENDIYLTTSQGDQFRLILYYQPIQSERAIRLVYPLGADSSGTFDAPVNAANTVDHAVSRIQLTGRILQSMTAELFHEEGLPRQTFNLLRDSSHQPVVAVQRSPLTVSELRSMEGIDLYWHYYDLFGNLPNRDNIIDIAVMADTHYDASSGSVQAHTALGGGRLALFGGGTLYSYAETVDEIESHFTDPTQIESYLFPEYGRASQYWAAYTTSVGAILHELGHCFGLPHPDNPHPGDIMARGFDYLNRLAVTYEPGLGPINTESDVLPRWTEDDLASLQTNPWLMEPEMPKPTPSSTSTATRTSTPTQGTPTNTPTVNTFTPTPSPSPTMRTPTPSPTPTVRTPTPTPTPTVHTQDFYLYLPLVRH